MSGVCKGASTRIKTQYPKVKYVHCASRHLNLCVTKTGSVAQVKNMMDTLGELSRFFSNSPKRQGALSEKIKVLCPESKRSKLLDICQTRWVQRLDVMEVFSDIVVAVVETLDLISMNAEKHWNPDSVVKANGLYHAITNFPFIAAYILTRECLSVTTSLTVKLQYANQDSNRAYLCLKAVRDTIEKYRSNLDSYYLLWFQQATALASLLEVDIQKPRTCGRQTQRSNIPAESVEQYFKRAIAIPILDHLYSEINDRFFSGQETILSAFSVLPATVLANKEWAKPFKEFCMEYIDDLPSPSSLNVKPHLWESYWKKTAESKKEVPKHLTKLLPIVDADLFPNIRAALVLLGTMPVTSCECERSVSLLRRLKTYLRSTMNQSRTNGLALLSVYSSLKIDIQAVIDIFARQHPRKMVLLDIIN
ncbi:52 kDa repressor of the inhibitor of the protein kinase-like [Tubulanus polymorphus]|uniref:52 kDa repressor of the inhibitor of the protein kinase-like n=1 Tax=Tubulanus polymorphus TaxID=672921 RepID=UPI003DA4B28F